MRHGGCPSSPAAHSSEQRRCHNDAHLAARQLATPTTAVRPPREPDGPGQPGRGCQTVSLMEYVILIIVIAVLAVGRRLAAVPAARAAGRVAAPRAAAGPGGPARRACGRTSRQAGRGRAEPGPPQATAAVVEVERPPPSAGRMVRLRARLARSQSSVGSALLSLLSRDRLDDETWDEIEEVLITADVGVAPARLMVDDLRTKVKVLGARGPAEVRELLRAELLGQLGDGRDRSLRTAAARRAARGGAHGRRERHRQDDDLREARPGADRGRADRAAGRGRHLPRGRRRPAADVGRAGGRQDGPGRPGGRRPGQRGLRGGRRGHRRPGSTWCSSTPPAGCTPRSG